ncbi:MAG: lectin-like protein [Dolichospermum sp.]|jgi:Ca2+-binding RTX toxin-like protein
MATINGTAAADNLVGTTSDDILNGLGGNDTLNGGGGNDQIFGDVSVPYFAYNGKFYLLSNAGTWQQAQAQAVTLGGNLVTVNDAAENQFLVNTFGGTEGLWIGLTDEVTEGTFKWANGEAVTYTNWSPGQPDNSGGNQDYAWTNFQNPGKWDDAGGGTVFRGIIEIANPSNDTIIGSTGNDTIDGGIGQDTADYSTIGQAITLKPTGVVTKGTAGTDQLIGVEKIIGATGQINIIDASTATGTATINANLATNSLVVNTGVATFPTLSFTVTNFVNVIGTANNDIITGDNGNNTLIGNGGNDTLSGGNGDDSFIGGTGNDSLDGGANIDTANYSTIGQAITLKPTGVVTKGTAGTDQLVNVEKIIGATGLTNIIDASTATGTATINANLATQSLIVNTGVATPSTLSFTVTNFVNVIGTANNDIITGDNGNNSLIGNGGNDTLNGGGGNDQIFGDVSVPYFAYNGKFYLLSNAATWKEAQAQAVTLGGNLVTVNDATENQFLVNTFGGTERLWIGLTDEVTEGTFQWANGEAVTYTNWSPGQPDNANNEDYAELNLGGAGKWNDLPNSLLLLRGIIEIANPLTNDTIIGSAGDDTINGGLGSDTVNYSSLTEAITLLASGIVNKGSFGTDKIVDIETVIGATGQSNTIDASTGTATTTSLNVNLATNSLIINGLPAPINFITLNVQNFLNVVGTTQNDTIKGNNLANELVGNTGNDTIQGNDGNDILDGGEGNDQLFGGNNDDQLFGGIGNDILQGDNGNDLLNGGEGNDTLKGLAGDDILDGGVGSDSLLGGIGNDILIGDLGDDILNAEAGDDLVFGDDGNDRLYGGDGFDELNGGIGKDFLYGGNNNDTLFGNNDNDTLYGEAGDDILDGGQGSDVLLGGLNNDIFVIAVGNGSDIVQDFQDGFDKMGLSGGLLFSQLTILGSGTNTLIRNTSSGQTLATLQNVSSTLITNLDFLVI